LGLGIVAGIVVVARWLVLGDAAGAVPADALIGVGVTGRLLTTLQVVPTWLRLLIWPNHLQADYSPNEIMPSTGFGTREAAGLLIVVGAVVTIWFARRRAPPISFGLAWCAIALLPVSNVVPTGVVVAERTLFLPSAGACLVLGALAWWVWERLSDRRILVRVYGGALAVVLLLGLGRSARRQLVWRNSQRLATVTALDAPRSLRVQRAHREAVEDLIADYERRAKASPQPWRLRNELAGLLVYMHEDSLAASQLRLSLSENPQQPDAAAELSRLETPRGARPH
jgi:hypothetical protein